VAAFLYLHRPVTPGGDTAPAPIQGKPANVLLITIDTMRADFLNAIGRRKTLTPYMDRMAKAGALFTRCITAESVTGPSIAAIMTGKQPSRTGIQFNLQPVPEEVETLAEIFRQSGRLTAGFVSASLLSGRYGFRQGFDFYSEDFSDFTYERNYTRTAAEVNRDVIEWLDRRDTSRPFFAWIHYFDPHSPYCAHSGPAAGECLSHEYLYDLSRGPKVEKIHREIGKIMDFYSQEITYTDLHVGDVLVKLEERGELGDTLVVLTADHGEELFQHGYFYGHGASLYNNVLNVPLIIMFPGREHQGARVDSVARTIDIFPTLLDFSGIAIPPGVQGRSLLPVVRGEQEPPRIAFSIREPYDDNYWNGNGAAATAGGWKLMVFQKSDDMLFNLESDPLERENLIETYPEKAETLRKEMQKNLFGDKAYNPGKVTPLADDEKNMLRQLGYLR